MLFNINVPHVLQKIFLSLDYESYKTCLEVSKDWHELLTSEPYRRKAKDLFKNEITEDEQELRYATTDGNIENIKRLLSSGMLEMNYLGIFGDTPLHIAAYSGHIHVVKLLLDRGAQHDSQTLTGHTPLHMAAHEGHLEIVQLLLDVGANPNARTPSGQTPLDLASAKDHEDVANLLLRYVR